MTQFYYSNRINTRIVSDNIFNNGLKYMAVSKKTPYGGINISLDAIAKIAGDAAKSCYGVLGLADKDLKCNDTLGENDYARAVKVHKKMKTYEVDLYLVLAFSVKVPEIVNEIKKTVKYNLERTLKVKFKAVNIYVQRLSFVTSGVN